MAKDLFRKQSLDRLSSPEQLDLPGRAVTPRGWLAFGALSAFLAAVLVWSVVGTIPTDVSGLGVLVSSDPSSVVVANDGGVLVELCVGVGQEVRKGEVIARLHQADLETQVRQVGKDLAELKRQHERLTSTGEKSLALDTQAIGEVTAALRLALELAQKRQRPLEELVRKQQELLNQSLITEQQLLGSKQALDQVLKEISDIRTQLKEQEARLQKLRQSFEAEKLARQLRIDEVQLQLDGLEQKRQRVSQVLSPRSGRVAALRAAPQTVIAPGTPLLLLTTRDQPRQGLHVLAYVSATQGKRIQPGMRAEVSPTTVKREQYGYVVGRVESVSALPVDAETLMVQLENKSAVQQVLERVGVPYAVSIDLEADPGTVSGYQWSSSQGPGTRLDAGTPCTVEVTVQRQPPITLVLPFLKKKFGLE